MIKDFTIIVPVFNEEACLPELFQELKNYIEISAVKSEVLFVDDGSTDNSPQLIETYCLDNPDFNFLLFDKNYGKGAALKAGFDLCKTSILGYMDADLQTHPEDFEKLLPYIEEYDLVTGWRKDRKDSGFKKISSKIGNAVRKVFTKDHIHDTGCPLKIIKTTSAKRIPMFKGLQRFLPAMILLQNGKIKEVPIPHYPRIAGFSKYSLKNRFMGPLLDCFAFLWMRKSYINYKIDEKG
ncbi:glycosyltransferase family 2 protein [Gramella sp. AN32]|uniref:Glycosyltransferase family 2 protein n=1 Tax=Christiangramia antarctica TaxID=2058158 RepID=A0ABW5X855_9FLAO|nr:glycosyltransferase family 2 protein [Gramella sp. AN32]MCM4156196.1 dolichol-phosphate mannosyltransferase [Gramella sp. AN32]